MQNLAGNHAELRSLCQAAPASRELLQEQAWDWKYSFKKS